MAVFVKFWGTRGSIPTPGSWTRVYGGNTSCVEIRFDDTVFICDAGSGIRELGKDLLTRNPVPKELHLLITHTHWDHIQGFPFFAPAHVKDIQIHLYGPVKGDDSRFQLLSGQMSSAYFPVGFGDLGACIISDDLGDGVKTVDGVTVRSFPLNHPGGCHGYSFEKDGIKIVYMTDNEMVPQEGDRFPDPYHEGKLRQVPADLIEVAKGAELLIIDSQYDDNEYDTKRGWGHSSCNTTTDLALQAGVKSMALFHHDPELADAAVEARVESCRERVEIFKRKMIVFAAREGVELKITPES